MQNANSESIATRAGSQLAFGGDHIFTSRGEICQVQIGFISHLKTRMQITEKKIPPFIAK